MYANTVVETTYAGMSRHVTLPYLNPGQSFWLSYQAAIHHSSMAHSSLGTKVYLELGATKQSKLAFHINTTRQTFINVIDGITSVSHTGSFLPTSFAHNPWLIIWKVTRNADHAGNPNLTLNVYTPPHPDSAIGAGNVVDINSPFGTASMDFPHYTNSTTVNITIHLGGGGFDEVYFGHIAADVAPGIVPESATITTFTLGIFGLLRRRRTS